MLVGDPFEQEDLVPLGVSVRPNSPPVPLAPSRRKRVGAGPQAVGDQGAEGEGWRNVLLDQLRAKGANFFGV